ncbi:hypothetical protein Clacol_003930 [Clathrus columnatus]|uniref:Conserved oligomeric Golgi complex subunit 1 n=1 Tax=Clathrus columnatus TaxID=1419009 RepID=A0AAV5A4Z6_9AGAM|nr:hypothetical protein Clacol_003930 [Clathrus columnatus]
MASERARSSSSATAVAKSNPQLTTSVISNSRSFWSTAQTKPPKISDTDFTNVDPDSLFVKYSIFEIKAIQAKLKTEADAKQEELRLMVGERYRDLLQASTSIMSMAESSRRVVDALYQMKQTTSSVQQHKPPRITQGQDDNYLKVLQSLSTHLKLLLDAPESLWRFLERKEYLNAIWLFMLSRVVYHALTSDNSAETPWNKVGINVQCDFVIDAVPTRKKTVGVDISISASNRPSSDSSACATLLSLYFLNSLPLLETLSTLLSQRGKMLDSLLEGQLRSSPTEEQPKETSNRKILVSNLQKPVLDIIDVICGTMRITRDVFQAKEGSARSMIEQYLEDLHSSNPSKTTITTSTLLSTLPSSAQLLTLPRTILTYKPYIDLTSPSTRVDPLTLDHKLLSWFEKALSAFAKRIEHWLEGLVNVNEVWSTRKKISDRLQSAHGLKESERASLQDAVDTGVRTRVVQLLNLALESLEDSLQKNLTKILQAIKDSSESDVDPSSFLFSSSELSSLTQTTANLTPAPITRFKTILRHRIEGRTPLLESALQDIQSSATQIEEDLDIIRDSNVESEKLQQQVMKLYKESLLASSSRLSEILETFVKSKLANNDIHNLDIIIGRLCHHLSLSESLRKLQYTSLSDKSLLDTLHHLQDLCIDSWHNRTISKAVIEYEDMLSISNSADQLDSLPTQPSSCLINVLMLFTSSLNDLGLPRHYIASKGISKKLLTSFESVIADKISVESVDWHRKQLQFIWDMIFLSRLQSPRGSGQETNPLKEKLATIRAKLDSLPGGTFTDAASHLDSSTLAYLLRSQTLFGLLLNDLNPHPNETKNGTVVEKGNKTSLKSKPTSLLRLGIPDAEQDYLPSINIAKPSGRFTILLISSTEDS